MEELHSPYREHLRQLGRVGRAGIVTVARAAEAWGESTRAAALRLGRLKRSGWVRQIRRGVYHLPPIEAGPSTVVADPWVLADELFGPCYIAGWSAAEYWSLTEQLFQSTFVATAASVRRSEVELAGTRFRLAVIPRSRLNGFVEVWRGTTRVGVSTPERTIVDTLRHPAWVGGIRHLGEILRSFKDSTPDAEGKLLHELIRSGNGAAHKRAGYLAETLWPGATNLIEVARCGSTKGVVKLDPANRDRGTMLTRWGLWVNAGVGGDQT